MWNFDWDPAKDKINKRKHGVSFHEASTVFFDENGRFMADPDHSDDEQRFVMMGLSTQLRTLVVCHCYRDKLKTIRIITARKATHEEAKFYGKE